MDTREIAKEYRLSHWSQVMQERINRGHSVIEYCAEEKISKNTYFYWQRKLREAAYTTMCEPEEKALVPKGWTKWESTEKIPENRTGDSLSIEISGCRVQVGSCTDWEQLREVCRTLKSL